MTFKTTDLCDAHSSKLQIAAPLFRDYGGKTAFAGPIQTIKTYEDNSQVRVQLEKPGEGRVLVVDGGGSRGCALLGDQLAGLAFSNGWSGVVVHGCIRDAQEIFSLPIGVKALATHPLKSVKNNYGNAGAPVTFAGVTFVPGEYLYADIDGIVVSKTRIE